MSEGVNFVLGTLYMVFVANIFIEVLNVQEIV